MNSLPPLPSDIYIGDVYRNNKNGKEYFVAGIGRHSETLEPMVSYVDDSSEEWYRPYELFKEKFTFIKNVYE